MANNFIKRSSVTLFTKSTKIINDQKSKKEKKLRDTNFNTVNP